MTPDRRAQLAAFLESLGLEPGDRDLTAVDEALTHTSAGLAFNHERLEFLGDAVLRLAASEYLQRHHPEQSVGQRAALRAQLVSDRWLADLGQHCGIASVLTIGAIAAGDRTGRATLRAEACEALIGALYDCWGGARGGLAPVHRWLTPHWRQAAATLQANPDLHNWKSALQEWSQGQGRGLPSYTSEEVSTIHGDPRRFHCHVSVEQKPLGEGWGRSRRQAEQDAARMALEHCRTPEITPAPGSSAAR
ncbi:MAG: ribonuclease III [Cyanobacteriota bacterium]